MSRVPLAVLASLLAVALPCVLAVGLGLVSLSAAGAAEDAAPASGWRYEVRVAPDLGRLHVVLRFQAFAPRRLVFDSDEVLAACPVHATSPGARLEAAPEGGLAAVGFPPDGVVEYDVDLHALAAVDGAACRRVPGAVVTWPSRWLLRPAIVPDGWRGRVTFDAPEGVSVSTSWPRADTPGAFLADETTWRFVGHVAFGALRTFDVEAFGCRFEVARADPKSEVTRAGVERWLSEAARAVATLYGTFPQPRAQVLLLPGGRGREPVTFGSAWRGGGAGLVLHLAEDAADAALPGEWVAAHEMIHVGQPVIDGRDAWFSEGVTTYYQEVLRARSGHQGGLRAYAELEGGFATGAKYRTETTLRDASEHMRERHAFYRVYWDGASLAMKADVALRRASSGKRSLDDAMRFLKVSRGDTGLSYRGEELVAALDAWYGAPLFSGLYGPALERTPPPSLDDERAFLGVVVRERRASMRADAPGADVARALMGISGATPTGEEPLPR